MRQTWLPCVWYHSTRSVQAIIITSRPPHSSLLCSMPVCLLYSIYTLSHGHVNGTVYLINWLLSVQLHFLRSWDKNIRAKSIVQKYFWCACEMDNLSSIFLYIYIPYHSIYSFRSGSVVWSACGLDLNKNQDPPSFLHQTVSCHVPWNGPSHRFITIHWWCEWSWSGTHYSQKQRQEGQQFWTMHPVGGKKREKKTYQVVKSAQYYRQIQTGILHQSVMTALIANE